MPAGYVKHKINFGHAAKYQSAVPSFDVCQANFLSLL